MIRVVLDTNNLVSAQISKKGPSAEIYQLWQESRIILFTSPFQIQELKKVLTYSRIQKKYKLSPLKIQRIINIVQRQAVIVYPLVLQEIIKKDPADNQILAITQEAKVDYLISGDRHLLRLNTFQKIPIVTARQFLKKF